MTSNCCKPCAESKAMTRIIFQPDKKLLDKVNQKIEQNKLEKEAFYNYFDANAKTPRDPACEPAQAQEGYESSLQLAISLAKDHIKDRLDALREKLKNNSSTLPVFIAVGVGIILTSLYIHDEILSRLQKISAKLDE